VLSYEERTLLRRSFAEGRSAFLEANYSAEMVEAFLAREDVRAEAASLQIEFNHQEALFGRATFLAKKQLAVLATSAAAILGKALAGPVYRRDAQGNIVHDANGHAVMIDPGVNAVQLRAAENILDALGVSPKQRVDRSADANLRAAIEAPRDTKIEHTDTTLATPEERTLSRERTRNVILRLAQRLPEIKKEAERTFKKHARGRSAAHPASKRYQEPKPKAKTPET
jgi:hypothetical protein